LPNDVFGTWKSMTRLFNKTTQVTTITVGADTAKNNWVIGATGQAPVFTPPADTPDGGFAALTNQGFGAEIRWNVDDLHVCIVAKPECNNMPGTASTDQTDPKLSDLTDHIFRIYFMVHDGDQHQSGGDVGHNCATVFIQ